MSVVFEVEEKVGVDVAAGVVDKNGNALPRQPGQSNVGTSEVDSRAKNNYQLKKNAAEGMMDIALLTANANQLRFLLAYNSRSKTFYFSLALIVISLILQVVVGIGLIFKRQMKNQGKRRQADQTNNYLTGGVFIITIINVFAASFTNTDPIPE